MFSCFFWNMRALRDHCLGPGEINKQTKKEKRKKKEGAGHGVDIHVTPSINDSQEPWSIGSFADETHEVQKHWGLLTRILIFSIQLVQRFLFAWFCCFQLWSQRQPGTVKEQKWITHTCVCTQTLTTGQSINTYFLSHLPHSVSFTYASSSKTGQELRPSQIFSASRVLFVG